MDGKNVGGSALILTVVLTSLLAIIGIMFVMAANMDRITTSSVSANKELQFAVDSVVAQISQELTRDVPGIPGAKYYDYPDDNVDTWLADLEPDDSNNWRHITDLYGEWGAALTSVIVPEHQTITGIGADADADGDGVADSKWTELRTSPGASNQPAFTKSGKRIYTAIRIIDNGGMLNVNTASKFDANDPNNLTNGSKLFQINLAALSEKGSNGTLKDAADKLHDFRRGAESGDISTYEDDVSWRYYKPNGDYIPFDITDELEMRNRFLLNQPDIDTRLEVMWDNAFQIGKQVPFDSGTGISDWPQRARYDASDPNMYSYRHLATIHNMDRIIDPNGQKMIDANDRDEAALFDAIKASDPAIPDANAAQIAVNLIDYCDSDSDVTSLLTGGVTYYGLERPCIYISELALKIVAWQDSTVSPPVTITSRSYAIELVRPYDNLDATPVSSQWRLRIAGRDDQIESINWTPGAKYHVVVIENPLMNSILNTCSPKKIGDEVDLAASTQDWPTSDYIDMKFTTGLLELQREVPAGSGTFINVDSGFFQFPATEPNAGCVSQSIERDIEPNNICIMHIWNPSLDTMTLGKANSYDSGKNVTFEVHPADKPFITIGEIDKIFCKSAYTEAAEHITDGDKEENVKVNLTNTIYQKLFNHLTVFDPAVYSWNDPNETRIKGRININTAPCYVLAQLPWMQYNSTPAYDRAQKICDYRDSQNGFTSIGELMQVPEMLNPAYNPNSDSFEIRDLIFSRLSNLATVRSDVFTAYILVRLGEDGPQKRVIAILDRSDVYPNPSGSGTVGRVKIVALWPVPDSR